VLTDSNICICPKSQYLSSRYIILLQFQMYGIAWTTHARKYNVTFKQYHMYENFSRTIFLSDKYCDFGYTLLSVQHKSTKNCSQQWDIPTVTNPHNCIYATLVVMLWYITYFSYNEGSEISAYIVTNYTQTKY